MRAGSESQIPQRARCMFWQRWKRKTQLHMCLCNIAGNSSISEALLLASVNFCLVFINFQHCWLPALPHWSILDLFIQLILLFINLLLFLFHVFRLQLSLNCFFLFFYFSCHSSVILVLWFCIPMAAAFVWKDEPLCPISRGSTLSPTPLLLFLVLSSGSVSSHSFL